jgi:hypothetical protein
MSLVELAVFNEQILEHSKKQQAAESQKVVEQRQTLKLEPHRLRSGMTVSIVTPTTLDRSSFLELCCYMVQYQSYAHIEEWLLLNASASRKEQRQLKATVDRLCAQFPRVAGLVRHIRYPLDAPRGIGAIRNFYNRHVKGDVVVCFDDDDFYPPERVEHVVTTFAANPGVHLVACSGLCIFDVDLNKIFKFRQMHNNHGTNNTFGYTRLYARLRQYDQDRCYGEEASFTNNFSEPVVQLDMYDSLLNIAHASNTVNKRKNIMMNYLYPSSHRYITETDYQLHHFIKDPALLRLFNDKLQLDMPRDDWPVFPFDIVYYCGMSMPWQPTDTHLGGSEQAVKRLSEAWVALGYRVAVYTTLSQGDHAGGDSLATDSQQARQQDEGLVQHLGVHYFSYQQFKRRRRYSTVILWRPAGVRPFLKYNLHCQRLLVDLHDNFTAHSEELLNTLSAHVHAIDRIMVKSNFHKLSLETAAKQLNLKADALSAKVAVLPNGVRVQEFSRCPAGVQRQPHRFCYASCYTRGLRELLLHTWPIIKGAVPDAELHVYYGMDLVPDKNFIAEMRWLLKSHGVTDHGRQGMAAIIEEKHRANFQLYFTPSPAETDCISVRESLAAGCIPILSMFNVFGEREGLHLNVNSWGQEGYERVGEIIVQILQDVEWNAKLEGERERFRSSPTLITWKQVAAAWVEQLAPLSK